MLALPEAASPTWCLFIFRLLLIFFPCLTVAPAVFSSLHEHVCVHVCLRHVCSFAYLSLCVMCACMCVCMCTVSVCLCVFISLCICVCVHENLCVCVHHTAAVAGRLFMCVCVSTLALLYVHTKTKLPNATLLPHAPWISSAGLHTHT